MCLFTGVAEYAVRLKTVVAADLSVCGPGERVRVRTSGGSGSFPTIRVNRWKPAAYFPRPRRGATQECPRVLGFGNIGASNPRDGLPGRGS